MSTKTRTSKAKAKAPAATEAQAQADESLLTSQQARAGDNVYSNDELRIAAEGSAAYDQIEKDQRRHPVDWLKKVGPALLVARAGAMKIAGTTNVRSQAYRDAIPGELKRLNLTRIKPGDRSYCLKLMLMDELPDIEAWLAGLTNRDRLTHPKTIWKAWYNHEITKWEDEPGADPEDEEEYWGEEPDEREEIDCAHCGRKTNDFVPRAEGRYCPECHEAYPEGARANEDRSDDEDSAGEMQISPELEQEIRTWGEEVLGLPKGAWDGDTAGDDAAREDAAAAAAAAAEDDESGGDDDPIIPFSFETFCRLKKENAALRQRITDLESKLDAAEATRVSPFLDKNCLKLENDALRKRLAAAAPDLAPPTVPADDDGPPRLTARSSRRR
jgi:hypothetical protein